MTRATGSFFFTQDYIVRACEKLANAPTAPPPTNVEESKNKIVA